MILPDSTILIDYLLAKTTWVIAGLVVDTGRMARNLDGTRGLVFSGQLLLDLAAAGMLREEAYSLVQRHAMTAWENEADFRSAIENDETVRGYLSLDQLAKVFSLERQLGNIGKIFERVFQVNAEDHSSARS